MEGPKPAEFQGDTRFEVRRKLGAGATGIVYAALDRDSGSEVALKVLRDLAPEAVASFKQEFRTLADFEHPNLVRLGELIHAEGRWLFTMELVEGADFLSFVRPRGATDLPRLRHAIEQLVLALGALHAAGQVHRDVKPSNVLVGEDGHLKLLDFGLVAQIEDTPRERGDNAVGTTAYVAPEQAAGRSVTPAADFYALGAMLYEALTGVVPFAGPPLKVLMDKQTRRPRPPGELIGEVDADLEALCLGLLAVDPSQRPTASQVLAKLRGHLGQTPGAHSPTRSHVFFGRTEELAKVVANVQASTSGPSFTLITGPLGIGKTALWTRAVRKLAAEGALVFAGRCREQESVPYRAIDGSMEELAQHLSRLPHSTVVALLPERAGLLGRTFPSLSRVDAIARAPLTNEQVQNPAERRRRAFSALRQLLGMLARTKPVVLAIDDLHHADTDSLTLLRWLFAERDGSPLRLLATAPGHDLVSKGEIGSGPLAAALRLEPHSIHLSGLDSEAGRALAQHLLDLEPARTPISPLDIAREAAGHPRWIEELVQHTREGTWAAGTVAFEDVLQARLRGLSTHEEKILTFIALSGAPLALEVLREAVGQESGALAQALGKLRLLRFVRSVGVRGKERLELAHERVGQHVLEAVPPEGRRAVHRALALAYETLRTDEHERQSRHFREAGILDRAEEHARRAAESALGSFAFDRAARLYQDAVDLGDEKNPELFQRLGDALVSAGRGPEGARAYLAAADGRSTPHAIDLRRRAAELLMTSGHAEEGMTVFSGVLRELSLSFGPRSVWTQLGAALRILKLELRGLDFQERDTSEIAARDLVQLDTYWTLYVGLATIDPQRAIEPLSRHLTLALAAGEPYRVGRGFSVLSNVLCLTRDSSSRRMLDLAQRAEALAARTHEPHLLGLCQLNRGLRAFYAGTMNESRSHLADAERTFEENVPGATYELGMTHFFSLLCRLATGEVRMLGALARQRHDEAEARGDRHTATNLRVRLLPTIALIEDRPHEARALAEQPSTATGRPPLVIQEYWRTLCLIECDLYEGKGLDALAREEAAYAKWKRSGLFAVGSLRVEALWLKARAQLAASAQDGNKERFHVVQRLAERLQREGYVSAAGLSLVLRAALAELRNETAHVLPAWQGAEAQLRTDGLTLVSQLARLRRGMLARNEESERAGEEAENWLLEVGVANPRALLACFLLPAPLPAAPSQPRG